MKPVMDIQRGEIQQNYGKYKLQIKGLE